LGGWESIVEENEMLKASLIEEEIKKVIDDSYAEEAPSLDVFSFLFYQKFWHVIKTDFMTPVRDFEKGEVNVVRINYDMIILISKEEEARNLRKFRPISLINYSVKIFANALNNMLESICGRLLALNQTTFIKGRYIFKSVMAAHEIIHNIVKSNKKGLILKLDYEKAYDRVDW
jgi:hypothetical protein